MVGEKTKYSNACEHVLRGKGEKKSVQNSDRVRNIETINRRNCTVSRNKKITCTISEVSTEGPVRTPCYSNTGW